MLASCVNLSKCNWKIKKRRCVEFTIYLNVPKNKLEVHTLTWPPFLSSHKFVLFLISKTSLLPEFPLFRFKLYGVVLPFNAYAAGINLLILRQTLDEDYVLEKLFEIVLTLQQRFLFRNTFQQ